VSQPALPFPMRCHVIYQESYDEFCASLFAFSVWDSLTITVYRR